MIFWYPSYKHILSSRIEISMNPGWRVLSDLNLSGILNKDKSRLSSTWINTFRPSVVQYRRSFVEGKTI